MDKKTDLKLFGEIDKRLALLSDDAKKVLRIAITLHATGDDVAVIKQIVERRAELTPDGKQYADKQIGVDAPAAAE